ncbi:MAG: hypothetical protein ABSE90_07655 [Verrucomicrobiota bacterium]
MSKLRAATAERKRATLQKAVTATDQQIDALVYELYGLTPSEIKLVEGGQCKSRQGRLKIARRFNDWCRCKQRLSRHRGVGR